MTDTHEMLRQWLRDMHRDHLHAVARQKRVEAINENLSSDKTMFVSTWADYDQDDVVPLWDATCLSVGINPKHEAARSKDFAERVVAIGSAADDCIKKLNEVLRRYKNVSTHAKNPNSSLKTADELRTKIELSAFREWVQTEKNWELHKGFPGAPASTATPSPAPVPTQSASNASGRVWTPEKLAEVKAYREKYGTQKAAEYFKVSTSLIRQKLPSDKPQPKGYSAFTHRPK